MSFNPKTEYDTTFDSISLRDFVDYREEFVVRPPYQRKSVWSTSRQQSLLDSLFRRYYIPRIVIREVRLSDERTMREVVDGQQRITTAQLFLTDELRLPVSLKDIHPDLPGKVYSQLPVELRRFVDRELKFNADIIKGISDPRNSDHQRIAAEIFWRLQQGESLNYMEIAHARLSSRARNFIVKYGDDIGFDYTVYQPIDKNRHKHDFFRIYDRKNDRMQHLSLLARLLLIEINNGPTETKDAEIAQLIDSTQVPDGIADYSYENEKPAKELLRNLKLFYEVFKDDPIVDKENGLKEFRVEYFVISMYLLLRHLARYYVFGDRERALFRDFVIHFHSRWNSSADLDTDILLFRERRQQSKRETELREQILRQLFFRFASERDQPLLTKDESRVYDEAQRILIYRQANGFCQKCLAEGKPEQEARVTWSEYQADHVIPHSKGGTTTLDNAQLLCGYHNAQKGNRL